MSNKKGGYAYLKERVAKLEADIEKERDWRDKYTHANDLFHAEQVKSDWLYTHAMPWTRRKFDRLFGEEEC